MIFFVFIIVDNTRLIGRLGTNFPVPVEVFPVALGRAGNKKIRGYGNYAPAGKRERRTGHRSRIGKRSPVSWRVGGYRPEVVVTG